MFLIDPRNIVVEDGFNVRRDFDLDELKEQIKAKGVLNPLTVIAFKDENGDEKYRLVDGERRFRATMIAISEGADIPFVKALKRPPTMSREDLYIEQMMRNEGKRFTEYECALMFQRFKEEFGYTQVEIADKFKKSPAYISKCLSLLDLPKELQERIMRNELSITAAREIASSYETESDQVKAAQNAVKAAKEQGRETATNREVTAHLKESNEAKAVANALRSIWAYLDGEKMVDVDRLITLLDKEQSLYQAMKQYKRCKYESIIFDLETTGTLVNRHGIHQISGMVVIDGEVRESFNFHVQPNPKADITQEALDVAGVTKEQIMAYPPMGEVYRQFVDMLAKYVDKYNRQDKFFLAGYNNASFDNQFLRAWFVQNEDKYFGSWFWSNSIDVMVLATPYLAARRAEMENFKQGTVAKFLGIDVDSNRLHDALYDIEICKAIFDIVSPYKV